ncbi:aminotransferase class V-fold PLP-dependent enzyme [Rhodocytophaga rosea]|uniref:phosphoserine transaminase n=1 Tax=Rhodocytophaga rosea TaxID=2704465 RepID=A0A6C0GNW2_9BACT|nr:aminotransferase class V-fold PLP-dependent enzyme [Rhodocytophaga rosea]QHT69716.1 aminotransferase class V-fold PLP-dependent enzyme [Rhodocytophaga rosea]
MQAEQHLPFELPPVTFYPGPSKVYLQLSRYMQDAFTQGILSINHRSATFMEICRKAIEHTQAKLNLPDGYKVLFVSSATESWEIIAQSLIGRKSFHLYNGAFGQKWMEYTQKIHPASNGFQFDVNQALSPDDIQVPADAECIALTQNETSNGTQVSNAIITQFKQKYPHMLVAVDATSSLGGIKLDFIAADIWFASVQKCLGLPAGLGLLIVSPRAMERAREIGDNTYYNSLLFMAENIEKYQTHYTPNVLNIYLLMRVMEEVEDISIIDKRTRQQAHAWYHFFEKYTSVSPIVTNTAVRSDTVIAIGADKQQIAFIKERTKQAGIIIGNGYGSWKETSFRIANFPAISLQEIQDLQHCLAGVL